MPAECRNASMLDLSPNRKSRGLSKPSSVIGSSTFRVFARLRKREEKFPLHSKSIFPVRYGRRRQTEEIAED